MTRRTFTAPKSSSVLWNGLTAGVLAGAAVHGMRPHLVAVALGLFSAFRAGDWVLSMPYRHEVGDVPGLMRLASKAHASSLSMFTAAVAVYMVRVGGFQSSFSAVTGAIILLVSATAGAALGALIGDLRHAEGPSDERF